MKAEKIRFGIIGCGMIAGWHANAIKAVDGAELVGVTDNYPEGAISFAQKYGVKVFETTELLLESKDIDVICICTPSGLHASQAIIAANAKKHIVVEKPMALNLTEVDEVIQAVESNNVKMEIISQLRFSPAVKKLKEAVDSGVLGRIVTGDIYMKFFRSQEYYNKGGWRGTWAMDGGGALMNQGIHGIDLLRYVMGPVKNVFANTRTLARNIEVEDTAAAVVEFESGALGVIQATTSIYPGYPRRMEICGDRGSIVLEEDSIVRWDVEGQQVPGDITLQGTASGASSNPGAFSNEGHILQISDMGDAIINNRKPLVDVYEGRKPIEIIMAIYESSKTGKPVELINK